MRTNTDIAVLSDNAVGRRWSVQQIFTGLLVAMITAAALVTISHRETTSAVQIQPVELHLSAAEQAQWLRQTATPAGRAEVLTAMQSAFAGVGNIGVGATPRQIQNVAYTADLGIRPEWAAGMASDHFWIVASYADIANGAISGAVWACKKRVPGWLCDTAGRLLKDWARGWGAASNHGVWAAVYWWPPRVTGGRW